MFFARRKASLLATWSSTAQPAGRPSSTVWRANGLRCATPERPRSWRASGTTGVNTRPEEQWWSSVRRVRNFAAGMSGGVAYVLDEKQFFAVRCNRASVGFEPLQPEDINLLQNLIGRHHALTGSPRAQHILKNWDALLPHFIKVFPHEYKRVLGPKKQGHEPGSKAGHQWVKLQVFWNTLGKRLKRGPSTNAFRISINLSALVRRQTPSAGSALYGLRRSLLPLGLPP